MCDRAGVDVVWVPSVRRRLPGRHSASNRFAAGARSRMSWKVRFDPGISSGVLTVVAKLARPGPTGRRIPGREGLPAAGARCGKCPPDELGVDVVTVPTVRDPDEARRLESGTFICRRSDREQSAGLSRALQAGSRPPRLVQLPCSRGGQGGSRPGTRCRLPDAAGAGPRCRGRTTVRARLLSAMRVGKTRLIDQRRG
mgnify:CR=1 FL=1